MLFSARLAPTRSTSSRLSVSSRAWVLKRPRLLWTRPPSLSKKAFPGRRPRRSQPRWLRLARKSPLSNACGDRLYRVHLRQNPRWADSGGGRGEVGPYGLRPYGIHVIMRKENSIHSHFRNEEVI